MTAQTIGRGGGRLLTATISESGLYYIKYSDGLLIEWGGITKISKGALVTLPQPYLNTQYAVIAQYENGTYVGNYTNTSNIIEKTSTSFKLDAVHSEERFYDWVSIGRWK